MVSGIQQRAMGVFAKRSDIELVLSELQAANFPMNKVSVIVRNTEQEDKITGVEVKQLTSNRTDEKAVNRAVTGDALYGLRGLLIGLGVLAIPGIGSIMFAGAEATALATTLAGGAAASLAGALIGLGVPENEAKIYIDLVSQGYYLVIITGTQEIHLAERFFGQLGVQQWGVYTLTSPSTCRYKNAAGLFYKYPNVEQALTELKEAGYPMSQVALFTQNTIVDDSISKMNVIIKDDLAILGMPDNMAKHYKNSLASGSYLVVIGGTDIQMAAARTILEANRVEYFHIYSPLVVNTINNNYQVLTNCPSGSAIPHGVNPQDGTAEPGTRRMLRNKE
ncbi:hypothetical protein I8748_26570 [Nostoc sp. CENA67]|uniref:Uncharacterized protein n=1 Tax=Amazonocrinis nigriterrae CENA67 TaxID=2794033 RepID=A0A8J7HWN9_9NOST|nr:hypothetical protein [Amazonocrinis nigriterrae]MBH8565695.1 hypothetical protein [Amazonocrinis nigriterrae CENA67]